MLYKTCFLLYNCFDCKFVHMIFLFFLSNFLFILIFQPLKTFFLGDVEPVEILYTHKYLESDLIKYVKFIHSLGQPLIVRSHSKVHRSRGNPKEIPT
jgi:hypothetical protein